MIMDILILIFIILGILTAITFGASLIADDAIILSISSCIATIIFFILAMTVGVDKIIQQNTQKVGKEVISNRLIPEYKGYINPIDSTYVITDTIMLYKNNK